MSRPIPTPTAKPDPTSPHEGGWVLHLVPPNGGGVDRFVRDLCACRPGDHVLHVSPHQWVWEAPGGALLPLAAHVDAIRPLLGRPAWLHAHSVEPAVRAVLAALQTLTNSPLALTLHDVTFTWGDEPERAFKQALIDQAQLLTAPSDFIANVLAQNRLPSAPAATRCHVIPNGSDPVARVGPSGPSLTPTGFELAVVGAIGAHKGLDQLREVAQALPDGSKMLVLGYLDGQLTQGWDIAERLWVHGVFDPPQLGALLKGYGVKRVWFASGQPESFSYALSDVWLAGWPVTVPDQGALGERVRRHGSAQDHVYPPGLSAQAMGEYLLDLTRQDSPPPLADIPTAGAVPTVADMAAAYGKLYQMNPMSGSTSPAASVPEPPSPRVHLDGHFFRQELLRLQNDMLASQRAQQQLQSEMAGLSTNYQSRGEWIAKLEQDVQQLNHMLTQEQTNRYRAEAALNEELRRPLWRTAALRLRQHIRKAWGR